MPILASRLLNFTGSKRESKVVNNIPKCNFNVKNIGKMESSRDSIQVKNLDKIFQQSIEKSVEKEKKISNIDEMKTIKIIHKAVSSNDVRKKKQGNCLFTDYMQNNNNLNRVEEYLNKNKKSPSPHNSKEKNKNVKIQEDASSLSKKKFEEKNDLVSKIKRYNSSLEKEEQSELIRVIRNIRQYQDNKRSRKKSVCNSGVISIEDDIEPLKARKNLSK